MPSLINFSRSFFTSSEAISSDFITASLSGVITPHRTFSRSSGFFLSFKLNTRDLTAFLYLGLVELKVVKIDSSTSSANSSGVFTVPSGRSPSPRRAVVSNLRHESLISSPVAEALFLFKSLFACFFLRGGFFIAMRITFSISLIFT